MTDLLPDPDYLEIQCLDTGITFYTRKSIIYKGFGDMQKIISMPSKLTYEKTAPIRFIIGILHDIPVYTCILTHADIVEVGNLCKKYYFIDNIKEHFNKYFIESKQYVNILENDITHIDFFYFNFYKYKLFGVVDDFLYENLYLVTDKILNTSYYNQMYIQKKIIILFTLKKYDMIDKILSDINSGSIDNSEYLINTYCISWHFNNIFYDEYADIFDKEILDIIYNYPFYLAPPNNYFGAFIHLISIFPVQIEINVPIGYSQIDDSGHLLDLLPNRIIPDELMYYGHIYPIKLYIESYYHYEIGSKLYRIKYKNYELPTIKQDSVLYQTYLFVANVK